MFLMAWHACSSRIKKEEVAGYSLLGVFNLSYTERPIPFFYEKI